MATNQRIRDGQAIVQNPRRVTTTLANVVATARTSMAVAVAAVALAALVTGCGGGVDGQQSQAMAVAGEPASIPSPSVTGLPRGWESMAIAAANSALETCAHANSLDPVGCPQRSNYGFGTGEGVQWTLLNGSLTHAMAVLPPPTTDGAAAAAAGQVDVYGRYQMDVSYTSQGIRPYLDYSGGITRATMSWDGTSFQDVQFATSDVVQLPTGMIVPPFARPAAATDAAAMAAVQSGFQDCITLAVPPTDPSIPNCPQRVGGNMHATDIHRVLNSDPTQGALVSFDTEHGNVEVTGSFDMTFDFVTPPEGLDHSTSWPVRAAGHFTATLAWTGKGLQLLTVAQSW
jgi:hypothetical protein